MLLGVIIHLTLTESHTCLHILCTHTYAQLYNHSDTHIHLKEATISLSPSLFPLSFKQCPGSYMAVFADISEKPHSY